MLDVAPDPIGRIEFRGVAWEGLDQYAGLLGEVLVDQFTRMDWDLVRMALT
jgi:hypothetical protein